MITAGERLRLAVAAAFFLMAPTVGDIGSCGQAADQLDPIKFFAEKAFIDCQQCTECGYQTTACQRSCIPELEAFEFPLDCFPLVHDGEVCLNALRAASCDDYAGYIAEQAPTAPSECNFCPLDQQPEETVE